MCRNNREHWQELSVVSLRKHEQEVKEKEKKSEEKDIDESETTTSSSARGKPWEIWCFVMTPEEFSQFLWQYFEPILTRLSGANYIKSSQALVLANRFVSFRFFARFRFCFFSHFFVENAAKKKRCCPQWVSSFLLEFSGFCNSPPSLPAFGHVVIVTVSAVHLIHRLQVYRDSVRVQWEDQNKRGHLWSTGWSLFLLLLEKKVFFLFFFLSKWTHFNL